MRLMQFVTGLAAESGMFSRASSSIKRESGVKVVMKTDLFSKILCSAAALAAISVTPALADGAITPNDNLLPWIARVQVPPGITTEQLRQGVEVEVPGDEWPAVPTLKSGERDRHRVYTGTIHYAAPREKYHFWIQDMSNGSIHGVATNSHG